MKCKAKKWFVKIWLKIQVKMRSENWMHNRVSFVSTLSCFLALFLLPSLVFSPVQGRRWLFPQSHFVVNLPPLPPPFLLSSLPPITLHSSAPSSSLLLLVAPYRCGRRWRLVTHMPVASIFLGFSGLLNSGLGWLRDENKELASGAIGLMEVRSNQVVNCTRSHLDYIFLVVLYLFSKCSVLIEAWVLRQWNMLSCNS